MGWQEEFPDYPAAAMPPIPETWMDKSWGTEMCPRFEIPGTRYCVHVDYMDPEDREIPDSPRYMVTEGGQTDSLLETDDFEAVLRFIAGRGQA